MDELDGGHGGRVKRAKSLKRGKPEERITDRIKLERVLGVTVPSNAALANDNNGIVAYPAGCTVVLYNTRTEQQNHIINTSRKTITSLAYSSCGRYIVTGECGHQPAVRVWDLQSDPQSVHSGLIPQPQQVAEFLGHKYGVNCVAFSPTNKYVVSVGTQHDMIVNLWDWKNNIKVASNKVSTKVKAIAFSENGSYFVTVGNRHVKFWFLETGKIKYKEAVPLMGRSAILGEQRNNYFCDVACGKGECGDSTYAITRSGLLCEFNNRRLLDKWVELRTTSANCIAVGQKHIFVGCAEGIIRCFDPTTLRFLTTLPRCHYLGVDVALGTNIQCMASPPPDAKYPDTTAVTFDETNNKLTAVYNDHSIYIWNVFNIKRVGKSGSFLYHSACIWGVEMAPCNSPLPPGSFLTCSSDDTVRVWTLNKMTDKNSKGMYQQNVYSNELLKVVYVDKDLSYIKDLDISGTITNEKPQPDQTSYDGKNGVRCIRISPDGKHLASGDRSGNIRIHDTAQMKEQFKIEAHDSEVLCLEYSTNDSAYNMLASASRDRLIHVFDTKNEYDFVQTLDDHSSSITAVRFLNHSNSIQMVSCGADKSLIFRSLDEVNGKVQFIRDHNATGKTTLYDMEVDTGQKHVLTACQDRNVRIYSVNTARHTKTFKGSTGDDGSLIKVVLDRSGIYLATSCTDKSLSVYDYYSGECMATMCGHSELATGLRFTNDCRRLISASGDGCIFVWRVPQDMVITMQTRLSQQAMRQGKSLETELFNESSAFDLYEEDRNYRFSIGQLPQWAKKQLTEDSSQPAALNRGMMAPKGRWAQRAENILGVQSFYSSQPLPFPLMDKRFDSDGSKESSLDSGTEEKPYQDARKERMTIPSEIPANITIREKSRRGVMTDDSAIGDAESTAHDGDLDSDSEYRHRPLYYPSLADSASGNEFTVTNIDADELRKSQRKKKPPVILIAQDSPGLYDSDDDDDDASTPSGENDRNPMSLLSVSSESLDQLVSRERYLQSTFESMSGVETEHQTPSNKSSFSSKFITNSSSRNLEAIKAVKQTKSDPEVAKKRQELNKRIAETKKKLESVGHSSPLRYSQSIHNLSNIAVKDKRADRQVADLDCANLPTNSTADACNVCTAGVLPPPSNFQEKSGVLPTSKSVPLDLQLCSCYMRDFEQNSINLSQMLGLSYEVDTRQLRPSKNESECKNVSKFSQVFNLSSLTSGKLNQESKQFRDSLEQATRSPERSLNEFIRPRKLKLDKTLSKFKMHKSLPVSPVSEERQFADFVEMKKSEELPQRQSFSYFLDFESKSTDEGFKQICSDIEKFSQDFSKKYDQIEKSFTDQNIDKTTEPTITHDKGEDEDDSNFSSDSLEDYSFFSYGAKKSRKTVPPRRCVSNNEIYKYQEEYIEDIPKSESFYLNQHYSMQGSQESILSDENNLDYNDFYSGQTKSCCNSLESVLSNESDCKSAPLEILFGDKRKQPSAEASLNMPHSQSLPKNISSQIDCELSSSLPKNFVDHSYISSGICDDKKVCNNDKLKFPPNQNAISKPDRARSNMKTCQTQTDFETPQEIVAKKGRGSEDFQKKLLKFESTIAQGSGKKPVAFFVETSTTKFRTTAKQSKENVPVKQAKAQKVKADNTEMFIPSLAQKNRQYKSRFCNVLNNKPDQNLEIFEERAHGNKNNGKSFTLSTINFEKNTNRNNIQETSSLDRHLFAKGLLNNSEKITHKPPKAVRRHSSKMRKKTTYEYIRKEDFYKKSSNGETPDAQDNGNILNNRKREFQELVFAGENTLELRFKEKNVDMEVEAGSTFSKSNVRLVTGGDSACSGYLQNSDRQNIILSELYDSLDKKSPPSKMDLDSLDVNLNNEGHYSSDAELNRNVFDSLEVNVWNKGACLNKNTALQVENVLKKQMHCQAETDEQLEKQGSKISPQDKIATALQNIKILNGILRKIHKINTLVDIYKKNVSRSKVKALSSMFESLTTSQSYYNDLTKLQATHIKYRRRNLSLPSFVERRLNFDRNNDNVNSKMNQNDQRDDRNKSEGKKPSPPARITPRYVKNNSMMRSKSSVVLNQHSDSENDSHEKKMSRLMRPTISSHNKVIQKPLQIRNKQSYSTSNLSQVGIDNVSTSDDEEAPKKPQVPPRMSRQQNFENSHGYMNNKDPKRASRHSMHFDASTANDELDLCSENVDLSSIEFSNRLSEEVSRKLVTTIDNVVKIYQRFKENEDAGESQPEAMDRIKMSVIKSHKIVHDCIFNEFKQNNGNIDVNQTDTIKKWNDLVSKGASGSKSVIDLMQQYSDILLDMMQQKIHSANI
uniref:MABP1/WDR62 second WD40 domain-containing protein n=1 Tax=Dendroctonus ponderosae TaxID=77166 RepID=A0AAR5Q0L6_DENPD